jgi:serine/threonine-protein kinase RsbW
MIHFEITTKATSEAISNLTDSVMAFLQQRSVDTRAIHHTALVLSELLTNLSSHAGGREQPIKISVGVEPDKVVGEIIDSSKPFDPRLAPEPILHATAEDRPIGGLGLYLVRKLTCALEYARRNGENCTTFAIRRDQPAGTAKP